MSKTKLIYFLSAVVLIIGCYALNLSYSLFVDTKSNSLVDTSVAVIDSNKLSLSVSNITVGYNEEYLIKQTIKNDNEIPVNFGIVASSDISEYKIQVVNTSDNINMSYGVLGANESKDVYLYVKNISEDPESIINIQFSLNTTYITMVFDVDSYLAVSNIDNINKYDVVIGNVLDNYIENSLSYTLLNNYIVSDKYKNNSNDLSSLFQEQVNIISLPISPELNVPVYDNDSAADIYKAVDDYGISYYYRGDNQDNFVSFAGLSWKIIRINGDGSVKLMLNESIEKIDYIDNVLYMYNDLSSNDYLLKHQNIVSNDVKVLVDNFYEEKIINYQNYLADQLYCGDKTYNYELSLYNVESRLSSNNAIPSLKCVLESDDITDDEKILNSLSRYTSNIDLNTNINSLKDGKTILVNNDLKYPIGLLSYDEVLLSGSYLKDYGNIFTMTPINLDNDKQFNIYPVINIKNDVLVESGNGSIETPYLIK